MERIMNCNSIGFWDGLVLVKYLVSVPTYFYQLIQYY